MREFFRSNGLSIVLFIVFFASFAGHYVTGWMDLNEERADHGLQPIQMTQYYGEGHFIETVFENWESEFLQMGAFVLLTVFLYQKGSAESKSPGEIERVDVIAESSRNDPEMPWPVRRGGLALALYSHSLSISLFLLFLVSFILHAVGGTMAHNSRAGQHGGAPMGVADYIRSSSFWFESFQNWQSEFLSIGTIIVLAIFLRQRGSPESKPVDTPHHKTGSD